MHRTECIRKGTLDRVRVTKDFDPDNLPSLTKQAHKDECDVGLILKKYSHTGAIQHCKPPGQYFDASSSMDFHSAMDFIMQAKDDFLSIPSSIRKKFDNDPGNFIKWLADEANHDEAVQLGFIVPPEEEKIGKVEIVNPEALHDAVTGDGD